MNVNNACILFAIFVLCVISYVGSFSLLSSPSRVSKRCDVVMKWMFGKGAGSMVDLGGIGTQGEYYYIPSKRPNLKAPAEAIGKERNIPIFPRNQVLGPLGEEYLGVYEMRYRQLLNDIGDGGVFGHLYYSQENSKLALVGTLARVIKKERLDDGGLYVVMEGIGRFYIKEVVAEKPYLRAKVQVFNDYVENESILAALEQSVFDEVRYSVKVMKLLYPQNNYTINDIVLDYRPIREVAGKRDVSLVDYQSELERRSKFSFAVIGMLKTDPATKLVFLQEPILEKRYGKILKVLQESTTFLEGELKKRGVLGDSKESLMRLRSEALSDQSDIEDILNAANSSPNNWVPKNYNTTTGDWNMSPSLY